MKKGFIYILLLIVIMVSGCAQNKEQQENEGQALDDVRNQAYYETKNENKAVKLSQVPDFNKQFDKKKRVIEKPEKKEVRGIYLNRNAINSENIDRYIKMVKNSPKYNAFVMDLKDDNGKLTYQSNVNLVNEIGADEGAVIDDLEQFLQRLKDEGIYTIARVVTFKDPFLASKKPEWALQKKDGSPWIGPNNVKWIDPYKEEMWDYNLDIVEEIAESGIDEIQYDYIRFPENAVKVDQEVQYANSENLKKDELIEKFLKASQKRLNDYPVFVSADVFGLVTSSADDMGIGQIWEKFSPYVDFISPMNYPSHYSENSYGLLNPNDQPYELIKAAIEDAIERNEKLKEKGVDVATIRPWLQDFSFKRTYTRRDVLNQIRALNDLGINEYLLWNAGSKYTDLE
ncbi:putative glycoside hydrolase [Bacillaceae bacterium W0354]